MTKPVVHIVHCIDTEGPLYEPLSATFERLKEIFDIDLDPSADTLSKLQNKQIDLGGIEDSVAKVASAELLNYNDTWQKIDQMLLHIMSDEYRHVMLDSFGQGWIYNWFCLDFVGFKTNPRRRDAGFHKVFDHYKSMIEQTNSLNDGIYFHHHPIPFSGEGHHSATHYFAHKPIVFEILARRIIERQWFPCVNRPGFHVTRPDSHWLMEQFMPFDFSNQSCSEDYLDQKDLPVGRYGDWRRAPKSWAPYHPDHDDYQAAGNCRRWIARCLNIGSRVRLLTNDEIELAFQEAAEDKPTILSFTHHDFRDMRPAIDDIRQRINGVSKKYPHVDFRYCNAREAMRLALQITPQHPIHFEFSLSGNKLNITSDSPTFGPQPFLSIKTKSGDFLHDNLDFETPFREWLYYFDASSVPLEKIESVGIGACDATGNVTVSIFTPNTGKTSETYF